MSATISTMLSLGSWIPDFDLPDVTTGESVSLNTFKANKLLLVIFMCEHCPYVKHIEAELARIGREYIPKNVGIVAISSNDVENYPQDSPENLKKMAGLLKLNFSICFDETQNVAKAFRAACTPEFYLFDQNRVLVYRGQFDDSRPRNGIPVTGNDLRNALDSALKDRKIEDSQKPSVGCNIKWKPNQAPDYFGR